jgi:hypothetical protein
MLTEGTSMLDRYWVFPRKNGVFYFQDKITGKQRSARTKDKVVADRLLAAKNQSVEQPMLNRSMAKTYLAAKSPELMERTWTDVIGRYAKGGTPESEDRKERAFRSQPFARLLKVKLIDTEADHLFAVLEHKKAGNAAHHYLRRIHNYAMNLGWLLAPVMAEVVLGPRCARSTTRPLRKSSTFASSRRSRTRSAGFTTRCCGRRADRNPTSPI